MTYAPTICTGPKSKLFSVDPVDWDGAAIAIGDKVRRRGDTQHFYVVGISNFDPSWVVLSSFRNGCTGIQSQASDLIHVL